MLDLTNLSPVLGAFWPVWLSLLGFAAADLLGIGRE